MDIFSLAYKMEEAWPDGTHPVLFAESSFVRMPSFRPIAPFFLFFLAKVPFWLFLIEKEVCHIDILRHFLVTLIINKYGFVV